MLRGWRAARTVGAGRRSSTATARGAPRRSGASLSSSSRGLTRNRDVRSGSLGICRSAAFASASGTRAAPSGQPSRSTRTRLRALLSSWRHRNGGHASATSCELWFGVRTQLPCVGLGGRRPALPAGRQRAAARSPEERRGPAGETWFPPPLHAGGNIVSPAISRRRRRRPSRRLARFRRANRDSPCRGRRACRAGPAARAGAARGP